MNAYYTQSADQLFPIYGVNSLEEAIELVGKECNIIETSEKVLMNPRTGAVDFESGWDDLTVLVEVRFSAESECWEEI